MGERLGLRQAVLESSPKNQTLPTTNHSKPMASMMFLKLIALAWYRGRSSSHDRIECIRQTTTQYTLILNIATVVHIFHLMVCAASHMSGSSQ